VSNEVIAEPGPGNRVTAARSGARWLPPAWWRRLDFNDRAALGLWAAAHLALFMLAWAAAWVYRGDPSHAPLTGGFEHWDAIRLRNIAQYGYFSPHSMPNNVVMFPGFPLVLAATHLVLRNWTLSELAVSAVAGCFAVVSLSRLARNRRAVLYLLTMPAAIFLMVGYAECLFLAFAIPAWHAATRGRWWRASVLAGLAGLVRVDGVFLILALVVMALTGPRAQVAPTRDLREWESRDPFWEHPFWDRLGPAFRCCCAFATPAAYEVYLRVHTGTWSAWTRANQAGWFLHTVTPVAALKDTYWVAFQHVFVGGVAFEYQLEIAVEAVMVLTALAFLCWRRWPEAVYCGLAAVVIGTQTFYQSGPRTLLMLFPLCIALASLEVRRPWVRYLYFGICTPLAVVMGLLYLAGQWTG
jgi:hypothetical protein